MKKRLSEVRLIRGLKYYYKNKVFDYGVWEIVNYKWAKYLINTGFFEGKKMKYVNVILNNNESIKQYIEHYNDFIEFKPDKIYKLPAIIANQFIKNGIFREATFKEQILELKENLKNSKVKIAIRRNGGLGDLIMLIPSIMKLKKELPEAIIDVYVSKPYYKCIFEKNPAVNYIGLENNLKQEKYKTVFNLNWKVESEPSRYKIHRIDIFAHYAGVTLDSNEKQPELFSVDKVAGKKLIGNTKNKKIISIQIRSSRPERDYKFSRLIKLIKELSKEFIVIPLDQKYIQKLDNIHNVINLTGKTSIQDAINIISVSDYFIGVDSGLSHIAGSLNIPSLVIAGPINPNLRFSYYPAVKILHKKNLSCVFDRECYDCPLGTIPCMDFTVSYVKEYFYNEVVNDN